MDDTKENPAENAPSEINENKSGPIFESVPAEELKPEEVASEVTNPASEVSAQIPDEPSPVIYEENKSKYFIIGGSILFFIIMLFIIFRFLLGPKGPPQEVKLTYWGLWEDKQVLDPIIQDYQRKNPHVKIEYTKMVPQDYRNKLLVRSKNGQGPDIFRFHNTWVPEVRDVVTQIPSSVMTNAEFEKTFYKIHQTDLKVGNSYYGLPLYIDGLVLIYNDSLFKKAGISAVPANWDDLTDVVTKLTVKNQEGMLVTSGIALGLASNVEHFSDILGLMLIQNGSGIKNLDQTEAAGALESFRKFAEPPNAFWDESMGNSITAFAQEKVAIIFAPSWEVLTIKSLNPDIDLKVASLPTVPGGSQVSIANYWVEGVSKYSKNQIEAWKFLRYLVEKDTMTKLYELETKINHFGEPYSRVDLGNLLIQDQYVGPVIKQANSYVSVPVISRTYDKGLNDEIIQYLENAVNETTEGVSYAGAFQTAKLGVDQVLQKYGIQ